MTDHLADQFSAVAEAFTRKAAIYDSFGKAHPNLTRMREKVSAHIQSVVPAGSYLLELNAGTGLDAAALVQRGDRIHATDIAPGMVSEIAGKIEQYGLSDSLTVQQCSFTELDQVSAGPFDAIVSSAV
jgi:ubiquinone/menaquinone biosynthesis C-methylase UbiE